MICALGKIIEKVVFEQLVAFLESNEKIMNIQSDFPKKYNCEEIIQCTLDELKLNISIQNKRTTLAVFWNLQRAFETVDRYRLIIKLQTIGVDESQIEQYLNK